MDDNSELWQRAQARVGTTLRGKYRIDRVLGVGGMAVVYAATHRNAKRFAVKMLHPELSMSADVRMRFMREGYAANSVEHSGTVAVLDDDVADDGAAFIVMELLDGTGVDLLCEQNGSRMPLPVAASIVDQLLDVLSAAHSKGIIHRDIKPANLFATRDGTVKVLDFGIARARDAMANPGGSGRSTGTGMLLGTPAFMAPEQALAKSSDIDAQTDVWAAAATLFFLLSGEFVHLGENAPQLLIHAATARARSVAGVVPGLPPPIVQVIDQGLAFEKQARWPTAAAMRTALREAHRAVFGTMPERMPLDAMTAGGALARPSLPQPGVVGTPAPALTPQSSGSGHGLTPPPLSGRMPHPSVSGAGPRWPVAAEITSQPVAWPPSSQRVAQPKRLLLPVIAGGFALALAAGGAGLWVHSARVRARATSATGSPSATASIAAIVPVAPAVAPVQLQEPVQSQQSQEVAPTTGSANAPIAPATLATGKGEPATRPGKGPKSPPGTATAGATQRSTPAASVAPPGPAAATKPNCDPNFTLDDQGRKHWKPECFSQ
jgi:serine/threonine-protein kinase